MIDLMRHFNEDSSVQVQGLRVLHMFCNENSCRDAIVKAGAIATTMVAIQKHSPIDQVMHLALELMYAPFAMQSFGFFNHISTR